MDMTKINDEGLLSRTHELVKVERKTLQEILVHLREINDRRLFARMGYSSLIKFMVMELKYSESAAYRRFQALKLTKEIPAASAMIENGTLSLCNANKLQNLLKGESTELKEKALESIQDKSTRESEKILFDLCPGASERAKKRESFVAESSTNTRISVSISNTTLEKIDKLKARTKKYETAELLDFALDLALKHTDPLAKKTRQSKGSNNARIMSRTDCMHPRGRSRRVSIPALTKREVIAKAHGHCQYPGCHEIHFLEIDHKIPVAFGGNNQIDNLRLLCKAHHQCVTLEQFGLTTLKRY